MKDTVILGAGVAGLGAALATGKERATIYERENRIGGNCGSFEIDGFTFDTGIHFSFGDDDIVQYVFGREESSYHIPIPYNFYKDLWVKHPVQSNLFTLPVELRVRAIKDFVERPRDHNVNSYEDWLMANYGEFLTREFHDVYTKKYWRRSPSEMTIDWIGQRIKRVDLEEVLLGAMTEKKELEYYIDQMRYPTSGGFVSYLKSLDSEVDIILDKEAVNINPQRRVVTFSDGEKVDYSHLFSSIPMPEVLGILDGVPEDVIKAAEDLAYTSVTLVSIGFEVPKVLDYLWFYVYDEDISASRIYSPSVQASSNAPSGCSSLQLETYFCIKRDLDYTEDRIRENAFYSMKKLGFPVNAIRCVDVRTLKYANITYTHKIKVARKTITDYLESMGINLVGRYGEWKYLWSNQSLVSGYQKAKNVFRD